MQLAVLCLIATKHLRPGARPLRTWHATLVLNIPILTLEKPPTRPEWILSLYPELKGPQKFVDDESISPTQGATQTCGL